jgi:diguanylate cyclase (GGDEF)-like protein/PAS domain S-box-containing protein
MIESAVLSDCGESLYHTLFDVAGDAIIVCSEQGIVIDCNQAVMELFSCGREQMIGSSLIDWSPEIQPNGRRSDELASEIFAKVRAHGKARFEWMNLRADRSPLPVDVSVRLLQISDRALFVIISRDISEFKQLEKDLRLSDAKFSRAFYNSPEPIMISEILTGRIRDVNQSFTETFGYKAAEILGRTTLQIGLWEDEIQRQEVVSLMERYGFIHNFEVMQKTADNRCLTVLASANQLEVEGTPCWVIHYRDITQRIRMTTELAESEARFRVLVESAPDAIVVYDIDTQAVTDCNAAAESLFGCKREEILGADLAQFYVPEQFGGQSARNAMQLTSWRALAGEQVLVERSIRNAEHKIVICELRLAALPAANRRLIRGSFIDISERKNAERILGESSIRYRSLLNNLPQMVWQKDTASVYVACNKTLAMNLGMRPEDLIGKTDYDLYPADLAEKYRANDLATMNSGKVEVLEERWQTGDRNYFIKTSKVPLQDASGNVYGTLGIAEDITEQKRAQKTLQESESRFRRAIEEAPVPIMIHADDGAILSISRALTEITGYTLDDIPTIADWTQKAYGKRMAKMSSYIDRIHSSTYRKAEGEHRVRCSDGSERVWDFSSVGIGAMADGRRVAISMAMDVTARTQVEDALKMSERLLRESQSVAGLGSYVLDISTGLWVSSEVFDRIFEINGNYERSIQGWVALVHQEDRQLMNDYFSNQVLGQGRDFDKEYRIVCQSDKAERWVHGLGKLEFDDQGHPLKMHGTIQDITARKEASGRIEHLAFYDPLTDLPNRRLLLDRLQQALTSSTRHNRYGALLLLDMDDFKTLNDTLGHDIGDKFLVEVARRLQTCVREGDTVARQGGDEFVVILEDLSEDTQAATQAEAVALKILDAVSQPYVLDLTLHKGLQNTRSYHCTSSIGITLFRDNSISVDELMKRADTAMYQAKAAGRNSLLFFDPEMQTSVTFRAALGHDLREAVQENQFLLYYQPQMESSGRMTGAEALVRWQHPKRGMVLPFDFIPLAEETGLILPIGNWVLETACTQLKLWSMRPEAAHLTIAVNVSAKQFRQPDFVEKVLAVIAKTGVNPRQLKLELTESLLVENIDDVIEKMYDLKAKGVGFSLDDFGTGYSSLSYLKRLPLDQLKIDMSFVRDVLIDPTDAAIAKTIVTLAESLGLGVIAEGVETEAQRDFLARMGCHAYQGYLYSRPLPLEQFETLVRKV